MRPSALILTLARGRPRLAAVLARALPRTHWMAFELRRIAASRESVDLTVAGFRMTIPATCWVAEEFRDRGAYEQITTEVAAALIRPGMTVLDVGANVGYFTMVFAERTGPSGRVFAFEPSPLIYQVLRRNVDANHLAHVTALDGALSDTTGNAALFRSTTDVMASLRRIEHTIGGYDTVRTWSLDDFAAQHALDRLDFLKIDVEGAERLVLSGGRGSLARFRPRLIVEASRHVEQFGYSPHDLLDQLTALGYASYSLEGRPLQRWDGTLGTKANINVLALQPAHIAELPDSWFGEEDGQPNRAG